MTKTASWHRRPMMRQMEGKLTRGPARLLAILSLPGSLAVPAFAAPPDPVDILSVTSTETTLEIVHGPRPADTRGGVFKLDRAEGFWKRYKAGGAYDPETRTYSDPNVTLGHEYCYRIVTRNDAGEQTQGAMACGVFDGGDATVRPPAAAVEVAIERSEPHLHVVSFTDGSDNETGFEIQRRAESGLDWVDFRALPASEGTGQILRLEDDSVDMEVDYCYRVQTVGEHGTTLSNAACARTPPLEASPPANPSRPIIYAIRRPDTRTLQVSWSDSVNLSEWKVWLYNADDLEEPIRSTRVRDERTPPRPVQGASFDRVAGGQLYCVRVTRRNSHPAGRPVLCESPHDRRLSVTHVGPRADHVPELVQVMPIPRGLVLTIDAPREGQLIDVTAEDGQRFTHLGARDGARSVAIVDLTSEETYCVRVWVFNHHGSRYGQPRCAKTLPPEEPEPGMEVTYSTRLVAQIPPEGLVTYLHVVEPGPPRPAQLLRVRVIGGIFSGYNVRFINPMPGPVTCSQDEGDGVTVVPGQVLSGAGLATLFGSETPTIPENGLVLIACKLLLEPGANNTNPIPVDVTYRRP